MCRGLSGREVSCLLQSVRKGVGEGPIKSGRGPERAFLEGRGGGASGRHQQCGER